MHIRDALGIRPDAGEEENWKQLQRVWSCEPADAEFKHNALRAIATQSMEFREHNVEYGYTFTSTAIVPDGSPDRPACDDIHIYEPCTRPGHPLPHAWLDDPEGRRLPIMDIVSPGRFFVIAGEKGQAWRDAAIKVGQSLGVPVEAACIGHTEGDFFDPRCDWLRRREFGSDGAILVRPDRFVAWRSMSSNADPEEALTSALRQILGR
jgi:2,4-dichlorophenol 6-monooxygenase